MIYTIQYEVSCSVARKLVDVIYIKLWFMGGCMSSTRSLLGFITCQWSVMADDVAAVVYRHYFCTSVEGA